MIINCINCKENFEFEPTSRIDELPLFCHNCRSKFTLIDFSKLLNSKTPIVIPIAWSDDVLNGKTKVDSPEIKDNKYLKAIKSLSSEEMCELSDLVEDKRIYELENRNSGVEEFPQLFNGSENE
jgi:hypothetical protein